MLYAGEVVAVLDHDQINERDVMLYSTNAMNRWRRPRTEADVEDKARNGVLRAISSLWRDHSYFFVFVVILLVYAVTIQANGKTFTPGHISSILSSQNTVIVGTMAIGMALVIITGQIDLSIGSALVLCSGVTIVVFNVTDNILLTVLAALALGPRCSVR